MSGKNEKKERRRIRQLFGQEIKNIALEQEGIRQKQYFMSLIKPCPRWIPAGLWVWIIKRFVRI